MDRMSVDPGAAAAARPSAGPAAPAWPNLVRPAWDGTRKAAAIAALKGFPTTWQGDVHVADLAMVGSTLYTVDQGLYSVPLQGGSWSQVAGASTDATHLASDGLHLYFGGSSGAIKGLDASNQRSGSLGSVPSAVTGMALDKGALWVGTANNGVYQVSMGGGAPKALASNPTAGVVDRLTASNGVVYTLGANRVWVWPEDGSQGHSVPGSEGATALTTCKGTLYVGTADGWLLASSDNGQSIHPLGEVVDTPIQAVGTDGYWLYSSSGNTAYMMELQHFQHALCHTGFAAPITNVTVLDANTALVGLDGRGLTSMPR